VLLDEFAERPLGGSNSFLEFLFIRMEVSPSIRILSLLVRFLSPRFRGDPKEECNSTKKKEERHLDSPFRP